MLLSTDDLRDYVRTTIPRQAPYNVAIDERIENIDHFNDLSREGLAFGTQERRILLYKTLLDEKIYMQYPGLESSREGNRSFEKDARPILVKTDGTIIPDMDFKKIWDVIDYVGQQHRADIDILATIFVRLAYLLDYTHKHQDYVVETIDVETGIVTESSMVEFEWNALELDRDVLETLNDRFRIMDEGISMEAFLYYNDLLAQNEDCKYRYFKGEQWDKKAGRVNNCLSHLTVISHIRGYIGISKLIDSFQRTGVAPLPQSRFSEACGDLVVLQ